MKEPKTTTIGYITRFYNPNYFTMCHINIYVIFR